MPDVSCINLGSIKELSPLKKSQLKTYIYGNFLLMGTDLRILSIKFFLLSDGGNRLFKKEESNMLAVYIQFVSLGG